MLLQTLLRPLSLNLTGKIFKSLTVFQTRSRQSATAWGVLVGLGLWLGGCATGPVEKNNPLAGSPAPDRISIMSYNIENLFDATHDAGKDDFTYLPLSEKKKNPEARASCLGQRGHRYKECTKMNWDEEAVDKKIQSIADGILQVHGQGPDVLLLLEVENIGILKRLNQQGLQAAGYKTVVLIEGPDNRGIDIGFLSRFPLAGEPKLHTIEFTKETLRKTDGYPTRGILEVPVKLPSGEKLNVFGVHLPSQANPVEQRKEAVDQILRMVKSKGPDALWVVGGDWNITALEDDQTGLVSKILAAEGMVSHLVGCKTCKGTHAYRGGWSFLDILFFSNTLAANGNAKYELDVSSIRTPQHGKIQMQSNGRPARFDLNSDVGISDHLPIYSELKLREKK